MRAFRDRSIREKILITIMAACAVAVLITGATFSIYNTLSFNRDLERHGQNLADLLAFFSEAPLDFDDAETADDALVRIATHPDVLSARIMRPDGSILGEYNAGVTGERPVPSDPEDRIQLESNVIGRGGEVLGSVEVEVNVQQQLRSFYRAAIALAAIITLLAWGAAIAVTVPLRRLIAAPIVDLTEVARRVQEDHSVRANAGSLDEVGVLVENFNTMLDTLQARESDLRDSESQYHSLVDNVTVGIMRVSSSPGARIVQANPSALEILGCDPGVLSQGISIADFFDSPRHWQETLTLLLEGGVVRKREMIMYRCNGDAIWVSFSGTAERDGSGNETWIDCVFEDITDRKRNEEELATYRSNLEDLVAQRTTELENTNQELRLSANLLERTNEELKTFAYIVSHDLRAPLVNIKGFVAELRMSVTELAELFDQHVQQFPPDLQERLKQLVTLDITEAMAFIDSGASRMDQLINSILQLSRLGRRDLFAESVELTPLVRRVVESLQHQIDEHDARVIVHPLPTVIGDRTSLDQIFGNLLDNALKFLDPARLGRIEVSGGIADGTAFFSIADNGRGIEPKDIDKVFDVFRRVGKQDRPGEGMGLSFVRTLVRRHGGEIVCESEPGVGTTFKFTLKQPAYGEKVA